MDAKFVGLMIDESVDIAVFKKLVIYIQVVFMGNVKVFFAANMNREDGRADISIAGNWTTMLSGDKMPTLHNALP